MNRFRDLVDSYLQFVLKDIKDKWIMCWVDTINSVHIRVEFNVYNSDYKKPLYTPHGITLKMYYTEDIGVFDSEMMFIANEIKECIEHERNGKVL